MLFLSFYFANKWSLFSFIIEATISLALFLIHPWTWGVFVASLTLTTLISIRSSWRKKCIQGVLAALAFALPVGGAVYQLLPGMRSDLVSTLGIYQLSMQQVSLSTFEGAFEEMFFNWGSFLSPILLAICLIGAYGLVRREGVSKDYMIGWIATWCFGSILVAPYGYQPANIAISETQLWRMLYLSPLPFLLALGIERCGDFFRRWEKNPVEPHAPIQLLVIVFALLAAASAGFFILVDPLLRLLVLLASVAAMTLMMVRFPRYRLQIARVLLVSILLLFVANAAFRSLFPLLLDPHNLHSATSR
jgi:multisubunit Na+/H+ antiporter MnhG subunit